MLRPIRNSQSWGLGLANLDAIFNTLELEVRSSVAEIYGIEQGILSLEGDLELALRQREHALNALASTSLEHQANAVNDTNVHIQQNSAARDVITEPVVSFEQQLPREEQHADQVLHPTTATRSNAEEPIRGLALNADDMKKRLLQVLRHLRDTASFCREIPDLDRGFSNMLKKIYKELYDSLKELTSKSAGSRPATDVTAPRSAPGGASAARQAIMPTNAEAQALNSTQRGPEPVAIGSGSTGACAQPTSSRDLSALARLIHAKRLHRQADGGAARDPNQAPVRRLACATYACGNFREPTLYDGLPPTRVAVGPSQGASAGPPAQQPARSEPATDPDPDSQTQAVLGAEPADATPAGTALLSPTRNCTNSEGGGTVHQQTAARPQCGAGLSTVCKDTEPPVGGSGNGNNIGSPARLLHSRASVGAGLALIFLSQTAHPHAAVEPHSKGRSPRPSSFQEGAQGLPATQLPALPNGASDAGLAGALQGEGAGSHRHCEGVAHGTGVETQICGRVVARVDKGSASISASGRGLLARQCIKRTIGLDDNASLESMPLSRKRPHVGDVQQLPQT
ncbi:hypothetical protein VaNZ11_004067 [Volvox africanus]|uniref:Uncharacterized protein n=1 Tax=Volvox africanus TaxID=51714 RepID=A0ABQ5RWB8_9CHLO|nr:hypothetical protein VaNZ11_004067 [Volvox africanus]